MKKEKHSVVSVIGDGGMTGGLAFEALNNAGHSGRDFTVILNDNRMSISPNVGAVPKFLAKMETNPLLSKIKDEMWELMGKSPVGKTPCAALQAALKPRSKVSSRRECSSKNSASNTSAPSTDTTSKTSSHC
jgi:1-deoxy-D-xylulose-5-phosphate synthase